MSAKWEKQEGNIGTLTIEVPLAEIDAKNGPSVQKL